MAFVDLETTGTRPGGDAITEIAILRVENGRETGRWQSLVNPERAIPPLLVRLIGISDAMVASAPPFAAVADTVAEQLADHVFVAHNAHFDHAFLRHAFRALGRPFDPPMLCTLKLARRLYPSHHRHGLDALIARHGLVCSTRHRAMGDVDALWQFMRLVTRDFSAEAIAAALGKTMKRKAERILAARPGLS
ncbi:MAG: 3'-5' exonuclease [Azoarcus sp.]|jgi:DNA polymerase-3 subunit epsilon|nr:3'-5' exonuclease [Azoarcus sp.]